MPQPGPAEPARRSGATLTSQWFALLTGLMLGAEFLGLAGCRLMGERPPAPAAIGALVLSALLIGGTGAVLLDWLVLDKLRRLTVASEELRRQAVAGQGMELALNSRAEQIRRLRHDIRGALSPALLIADRLLSHADPSVQRAGQIMVRTVDRATGLLADPDAKADE